MANGRIDHISTFNLYFLFAALCFQFLSEVEFCLSINTLTNYRALFLSKENMNVSRLS